MSDESRREIIAKIIRLAEEHDLFTGASSLSKVINRFEDEGGEVFVILTSGIPPGTNECSECLGRFPTDDFNYYQARVDVEGYLQRVNALCSRCAKRFGKERDEVMRDDADKIPPRPKAGDICPTCNRPWSGNWHRDHDYKTKRFISWRCGNCNMAHQDRRNPGRRT